MSSYRIVPATRDMHNELQRIARTSKFTKDFGSIMFSSEAAYEKGWIQVAVNAHTGKPGGFYCVRQKVRTPVTELYFITVEPELRDLGLGAMLLRHLEESSKLERVEFHVDKTNEAALRFYQRHGYIIIGEGIKGTAHRLQKILRERSSHDHQHPRDQWVGQDASRPRADEAVRCQGQRA